MDAKRDEADLALSDEAIDWLVRLNSGQAAEADHAAFAAWRRLSEGHEAAAREAETIWHGLGTAGSEVRVDERKAARRKMSRRAVLGTAVLAAAGVAAGRAGLIGPRLFADHVTGIGERRTVTLSDGSSILLNAGSALSVDFDREARRLTLYEGEAAFTVAHDGTRPFIVAANGGQTRAIGTVFNVDIRREEVVVTVLEGVVRVTAGISSGDAVTAEMDQRVRYAADRRPSAPESVDANVEAAWRRGKLIFNRRPLSDVVAEIERYRRGEILLMSAPLRSLEVTGVFDLDDPEAILRTIEETLPVRIARLPFVTIIREGS